MENYRVTRQMLAQDWWGIAALTLMFLVSAGLYPYLPERVPIHWNAAGQIDNYGSRAFGAFMLPVLTAALYGLMLVLPLVDPRKDNYPKFLGAYRVIRLGMVTFMAVMHGIVLTAALGQSVPIDRIMPGLLGALFILIGNYLPRVRHNYFVGIRTPWTLANEEVWRKTHRMGGIAYVVAGVVSLMSAFLTGGFWAFVVVITAVVLATLFGILYSLVVFQHQRHSS